MRERLTALKAHWEENGACHFPWDDIGQMIVELEDRVIALETAAAPASDPPPVDPDPPGKQAKKK